MTDENDVQKYLDKAKERLVEDDLWRKSPALALSRALGEVLGEESDAWRDVVNVRPINPGEIDTSSAPGLGILPGHDDERETIANYVRAVAASFDGHSPNGTEETAEIASEMLRRSRVYHVDGAEYARAHRAADVVTVEKYTGQQWQPVNGQGDADEVETKALVDGIMRDGPERPLPALPFACVYVGFGQGVGMVPYNVNLFTHGGIDEDDVYAMRLLGFCLSETMSYVHIAILGRDGVEQQLVAAIRDARHGWVSPMTLTPWTVPAIVSLLRDDSATRSRREPTFSMKRDAQRVSRRTGQRVLPPRFYRVDVKPTGDDVVGDAVRRAARSSPTYQFDVAAHTRVLVRRGPSSDFDPRDAVRLASRGYNVFLDGADVDDRTRALVESRGRPTPVRGEWIAVKTVEVKDHRKGPEDAPHIPSLRVVKGGRDDD